MAKQIKTLSIQGYGGCILILGIYNTIAAMMVQVVGYSDLIDGSMAKKDGFEGIDSCTIEKRTEIMMHKNKRTEIKTRRTEIVM